MCHLLSTICCIQGFSGILSKTFSEHCSFYNEIHQKQLKMLSSIYILVALQVAVVVVFVFNIPPTAKVIWRRGHGLKSHPTDLSSPGIEPATPGLQGKLFIHYTTAAPTGGCKGG